MEPSGGAGGVMNTRSRDWQTWKISPKSWAVYQQVELMTSEPNKSSSFYFCLLDMFYKNRSSSWKGACLHLVQEKSDFSSYWFWVQGMEIIRGFANLPKITLSTCGRDDDVFIDRLNYKYTTLILFVSSLTITIKILQSDHIQCWVGVCQSSGLHQILSLRPYRSVILA